MRAAGISVAASFILAALGACSTAEESKAGPDGGKRTSTGGTVGSGGTNAAGGTSGAPAAADCHVDSGADRCRLCLASHCCSDIVTCFGDLRCRAMFDEYQRCVHAVRDDADAIANCYSAFVVGLGEGGAKYLGLTTCDYLDCNSECGAPSQM